MFGLSQFCINSMDNDEIRFCQHLLLSISHIESRFSYCWWKQMYFCTVCPSIREVFIRMKTDEIWIDVKWHSGRFTLFGCTPMKIVPSIESFHCYLQACKMSVLLLWFIAFYYAFCLEWINRRKYRSDVFQWKMYSGSFLILLVLPLQRALVEA